MFEIAATIFDIFFEFAESLFDAIVGSIRG